MAQKDVKDDMKPGFFLEAGRMGRIKRRCFIDSQLSGRSEGKMAPGTAGVWNSPPRLPVVL
jgi:hypothetical protein